MKSVLLNDIKYYIIKEINENNNIYYILANCNNNSDICIRKKLVKNNEEYLVGLDSEIEFETVLQMYHQNY